jgi:DNA-binding transcriptional regulator YiaG
MVCPVQTSPPNRIRELRNARGLRLVHLAAHCDVDQSTAHRWEVGDSQIPDEQKFRIARYLDVTVSHLMGWDQDPALKDAA